MSINLFERILTSIFLIILFIIFFFSHNHAWFFLIFLGTIIVYLEFINLVKKLSIKNIGYIYSIYLFTLFYLSFFVFSLISLSSVKLNVLFILLISIFSDIGGYIVGKLIGGKKLTKISPKKTISGSIGSFIFSYIPLVTFYLMNYNITYINLNRLLIFIFLISLVCQLGDIFISYFKRKANVKDTGKILPGHGGLLDRVDGLIFGIPAAYIFTKLIF